MKQKILPFAGALLALTLAACAHAPQNEAGGDKMSYTQISQEEAKSIMDGDEAYTLLDVRTEEEFAEGHIPGAICIPNETIDASVEDTLPDHSALLLVYCRSGNRSRQAAQKLADLGYTDVREFGGILSWQYEIEQ